MAARDAQEDSKETEDERSPLGPRLGWGGLAAMVIGALLRLVVERGSGPHVAGAVLAGLGLLAVLVGHFAFRRTAAAEPPAGYLDDGRAHDPEPKVRLGVTLASAALTVLGLFLLVQDALSLEQSGSAWPFLVGGTLGLVASGIWHAVVVAHPRDVAVGPPEPPARRTWVAAAVGTLLVLEAMAPLRYYLGDDIFDERFSWRMFSAVRVYQCRLEAYETQDGSEQPTDLMSTVQVGWITTMRRSREGVLRGYLDWRCAQGDIEAARVVNRCQTPEGNPVPDVVRRIDCASGEIEAPAPNEEGSP